MGWPFADTEPRYLPHRRTLLVLAALVPLLCAVVSVVHLKKGWDDGAITAAFSQSWADSGQIALTPLSPRVEGFSSLSWFLLLAIPRFVSKNPAAILLWMKLLACVAMAGSLAVFHRIASRFGFDRWETAFATALLAFMITPFHEAFNGMEMNFSMLLLLLLMDLLLSGRRGARFLLPAWLISGLLVATRFESPYMLVAVLGGCLLALRSDVRIPPMRDLVLLSAGDALFFILIGIWRHAYFGLWMPNTVYAKLWQPYHAAPTLMAFTATRVHAVSEVGIVLLGPILVAAIVMSAGRKMVLDAPELHPLIIVPAGACVCFGLIFGHNLGHPGRMVESLLPAMLLLLLALIRRFAASPTALGRAFLAIAVVQLSLWTFFIGRLAIKGDPIPVVRFEKEGLGPDAIRQALGMDRMKIMIPDVGGAGLCCERLEILDSALLTNPYLAKYGYARFESYFREQQPDVVEIHGEWAEASHVYSTGVLDSYGIVAFRGMRFFVRNDLFARLRGMKGFVEMPVASGPGCGAPDATDNAVSVAKGSCLVLEE